MDTAFPLIFGIFFIVILVIVVGSVVVSFLTTGLIFKGIFDLVRSRQPAIRPPTSALELPKSSACPNCGAQQEVSGAPRSDGPVRCPYCNTALP